MTREFKLGVNRGNPRLWLEGTVLTDAGFRRGVAYSVSLTERTVLLQVAEDGKRRVSGKTKADGTDHPIIDMNGANLAPWAGRTLTLTTAPGTITITT